MLAKHPIWSVIGIILGLAVIVGGVLWWRQLRGIGPALKKPPLNITQVINTTRMPLQLPPGFRISIFADNLPDARVMAFDQSGNLWVSQPKLGQLTFLTVKEGLVVDRATPYRNLHRPHGLAFDPQHADRLYVAETDRIEKLLLGSETGPELVADLPSGGEHVTRTIGFGPDGRLYVSIGSSCNACRESDSRRAAISAVRADGQLETYARGLRNSVFFTWQDGRLWATDMGRDFLGDDLPPDEVNIVSAGADHGWPLCYGQQVQDKRYDASVAAAAACRQTVPPVIAIPAHSAPLGLAFIPTDSSWPEEWRGNLVVAYHGSWNRSVPTGYKLVRYRFDSQGQPQVGQDFITGWLTASGAIGRPVDVVWHDQSLYVSDDKAGVIYRLEYPVGPSATVDCRRTGCSGQICSDHDVTTTCEFKPEYRCYSPATCSRQADGQCGWTPTTDLERCLQTAKGQSL